MPELIREDSGLPKPQYEKEDGTGFEALKGKSGAMFVYSKNGHNEALGSKSDSESTTGDGSVIALLKNLRTRISNIETKLNNGVGVTVNNFPTTTNIDDSTPIKIDIADQSIGPLQVTLGPAALFSVIVPSTGVKTAITTASAANTPEPVFDISQLIGMQQQPYEYIIQAPETNTGDVFIGGPDMGPGEGKRLKPGEEFRIRFGLQLFFQAENAGDKVSVFVGTIDSSIMSGGDPGGLS